MRKIWEKRFKWQKNYECRINYGTKQNVQQFFKPFQVEWEKKCQKFFLKVLFVTIAIEDPVFKQIKHNGKLAMNPSMTKSPFIMENIDATEDDRNKTDMKNYYY